MGIRNIFFSDLSARLGIKSIYPQCIGFSIIWLKFGAHIILSTGIHLLATKSQVMSSVFDTDLEKHTVGINASFICTNIQLRLRDGVTPTPRVV